MSLAKIIIRSHFSCHLQAVLINERLMSDVHMSLCSLKEKLNPSISQFLIVATAFEKVTLLSPSSSSSPFFWFKWRGRRRAAPLSGQ